jgi:hypothetical protein
MKKLFTDIEFKNAKSKDLLSCSCSYCGETFHKTKHEIQIKSFHTYKTIFCSKKCQYQHKITKINVICSNCGKSFDKNPNEIKKSKSGNHFCSTSCAATYNNTHKSKGNRRSKLEIFLEKELRCTYPELKIDFNQTDAIGSELDIFIPSLKLAFELNGIFHYEPIFGRDKLNEIQNNDNRKFQACVERNIEFCIIDTSHQKYFKEQTSKKFLNIIITIINKKLCLDEGTRTPTPFREPGP